MFKTPDHLDEEQRNLFRHVRKKIIRNTFGISVLIVIILWLQGFTLEAFLSTCFIPLFIFIGSEITQWIFKEKK